MTIIQANQQVVTRHELATAVRPAFGNGSASRDQLLETARAHGARPEALAILERLPRGGYSELRQLWASLRELPVA